MRVDKRKIALAAQAKPVANQNVGFEEVIESDFRRKVALLQVRQ